MITTQSPLTLSLATAMGAYMLAAAIGGWLKPARWAAILAEFKSNHALTFVTAAFTFALGSALIISHNIWTDLLAGIVSAFGWIASLKGLLLMIDPSPLSILANACSRTVFSSLISSWSPSSAHCSCSPASPDAQADPTFANKPDAQERRKITMNKITRSSDLMVPKVTTGPHLGVREGLLLARRPPRRARAVPRDRADRPRAADVPRLRPLRPLHRCRRRRSTSRRACRASAKPGSRERGGVEEYDGREIKPEDNGNVSGKHAGPRLPQQARSRCAACPASPSPSTNSRAPASSPRR